MVFNSIAFGLFFAGFFLVYWTIPAGSRRGQNLLLLAGSYVFYAFWNWKFLFLLLSSTLVTYLLGNRIATAADPVRKRALLIVGVALGLGALALFKYYDFFAASLTDALAALGLSSRMRGLGLILPLGISFYTFRNLSYLFDVYYERFEPSRDPVAYFAYVAFFPTLVSGPIDKPATLLPQFALARSFDYELACDGLRQTVWGLFKKAVVADNCATITDPIFSGYSELSSRTLLIGAFLYAVQIYADFSGYSDSAIGLAKLLGLRITRNFNYPFFAQNIAEFWRRWHISLTAWLTEYLFTPLAVQFRDHGKAGLMLAILINFTLIGVWHGANWTYVLFGFLHGCYFLPLVVRGTVNRRPRTMPRQAWPQPVEFASMAGTFLVVMLTFVLFRAGTVADAFRYVRGIFSVDLFTVPAMTASAARTDATLLAAMVLLVFEWMGRQHEYAVAGFALHWPAPARWAFYYAAILGMFLLAGAGKEFIYFQF